MTDQQKKTDSNQDDNPQANLVSALRSVLGDALKKPEQAKLATDEEVVEFWIDQIKKAKFIAPSAIGPRLARQILATGRVEEEELRKRGIAF